MFDFEDAHRKPCLPLIVWWSDAKAGDFLNRQKNKTALHSSLGTETSLENPEHTANTYALRKRSKALEDATPLLLCHSRAASCEETQLPLLCVVSNHICHEQTCSPQGIYTAWLVSGGQGCHWPLTRETTLSGLTLFKRSIARQLKCIARKRLSSTEQNYKEIRVEAFSKTKMH